VNDAVSDVRDEVSKPIAPGGGKPAQRLRKHSVTVAGHRTSISLEEAFWSALKQLAAEQGSSAHALIEQIDRDRRGNLSSAIRVYVLERLQARGAERRTTGDGSAPGSL
jgi:predicted DNA-binding ribbon-helix-helix protein